MARMIDVEEEIDKQSAIGAQEFVAGQMAPAGAYQEIETGRVVLLLGPGVLPASCDGRVAVYVLKTPTWREALRKRLAKGEKGVGHFRRRHWLQLAEEEMPLDPQISEDEDKVPRAA